MIFTCFVFPWPPKHKFIIASRFNSLGDKYNISYLITQEHVGDTSTRDNEQGRKILFNLNDMEQ